MVQSANKRVGFFRKFIGIFTRKKIMIESLNKEVAGLTADLKQCSQERNALNSEVTDLAAKSAGLTADLKQCSQERNALDSEVTDLAAKSAGLIADLKQCSQERESLNSEVTDLVEKARSLNVQLESCEKNRRKLEADFEALSIKQNLIKEALGAEPISDDDFINYRKLYKCEFLPFANKENSLAEEAQAIDELLRIEKELELISQFPKVKQRRIIAVGGGFSAGKSQFLGSFVSDSQIKLPIGINPVTAFPTYILSEKDEGEINGIADNGGVFDIKSIFSRLDHAFIESLGFNLRKIMPYVTMETPLVYPAGPRKGENIANICFIDTPGYNAASSHAAQDRDVSLPYLEEADSLLWLIGLDSNGTIPNSDLKLLKSLKLEEKGKTLYIIANKADCKPHSDLEKIVEEIAEELEDRDLDFAGISAFSSIDKQESLFHKESLFDFLGSQDQTLDTSHKIFEMIAQVMYNYRDALQKEIDHIHHVFVSLASLEIDTLMNNEDDANLSEGFQTVRERFNPEKPKKELAELKKIGNKMLSAAAKVMKSNKPPELEINPRYRPNTSNKKPN